MVFPQVNSPRNARKIAIIICAIAITGIFSFSAATSDSATSTPVKQLEELFGVPYRNGEFRLPTKLYRNVSIRDIDSDVVINIVSADELHPATFEKLNIRNSNNLRLSNINFSADISGSYTDFIVSDSKNVIFEKIRASSQMPLISTRSAGLLITSSDGVQVLNSYFENLSYGIRIQYSLAIAINGNSFREIRSDGVQVKGTSDIAIVGNAFTDFRPSPGDHSDAIQFFTAGTAKSAQDIEIRNNLITRGDGDAVQGIFLAGEATLPYRNVAISNNLVIGTLYNGIFVEPGATGIVTKNTVIGLPDQKSWLYSLPSSELQISANVATFFTSPIRNSSVPAGNRQINVPKDNGAAIFSSWSQKNASTTNGTSE